MQYFKNMDFKALKIWFQTTCKFFFPSVTAQWRLPASDAWSPRHSLWDLPLPPPNLECPGPSPPPPPDTTQLNITHLSKLSSRSISSRKPSVVGQTVSPTIHMLKPQHLRMSAYLEMRSLKR